MMPRFIGIGAAKAGTTWLAGCLRRHPEIFMPLRKEVNAFHYREFGPSTLRAYEKHFVQCASNRVAGEFSTLYLHSGAAPGRIAEHIPYAKLIVSLRNPIEQVWSHYWHLRRQSFHLGRLERTVGFEEALERYPHLLVEPALYHKHITRWLDHFPREQLLVLWFDDIATRPGLVLSELYSFLGVSDGYGAATPTTTPGTRERRGVSPRSDLGERLYRPLYAGLVRYFYNPMKRCLGPRAAGNLKELVGARGLLEWLFFRPGYPPMTDRQRELTSELFRDDTRRLGNLLGRQLTAWR